MTKKEKAKEIITKGTFLQTTKNEIWENNFYKMPNGCLVNIQKKDGKLFDVINYGR